MPRKGFAGAAVPTTLGAAILSTDTSFTIASATGWTFTNGGGPFVVVIDRGTAQEEKVLCSAIAGTTVTVAAGGRGYDGTTAFGHASGATALHVLDSVTIDESNAHVNTTTRDDHTQYLRVDGSRANTGAQTFGGAITANAGINVSGGAIAQTGASVTALIQRGKVTGNATDRYAVQADGKTLWSDGTNAADVDIYRSSAGRINVDGTVQIQNPASGGAPLTFVTLVLQKSVGETGSFLTLRDSGGANVAGIDVNGLISTIGAMNLGSLSTLLTGAMLSVDGSASGATTAIFKAGSTAPVLRVLDNSGVRQFEVQSTGTVLAAGASSYFGTYALSAGVGTRLRVMSTAATMQLLTESDATTANVSLYLQAKGAGSILLNKPDGTTGLQLDSGGGVTVPGVSTFVGMSTFDPGSAATAARFGDSSVTSPGGVLAITPYPNNRGLTIKVAATTPSTAIEMQLSDGTAMFRLGSGGIVNAFADSNYFGPYGDGTGLGVRARIYTISSGTQAAGLIAESDATIPDVQALIRAKGAGSALVQNASLNAVGMTSAGNPYFSVPAGQLVTTVGAAGAAAAMPLPVGYMIVNINGTTRKIPYFNV